MPTNTTGFVLVDTSEVERMKASMTAPTGDGGGDLPPKLLELVERIHQTQRKYGRITMKNMAASLKEERDLGEDVEKIHDKLKESLEKLEKRSGEIVDKLGDMLKAAASIASGGGRKPPPREKGLAAAGGDDDDDMGLPYDPSDFKKISKSIGDARKPAGAVIDLVDEMASGFGKVKLASDKLGDALYGHSLFTEMRTHLEGLIGLVGQLDAKFGSVIDTSESASIPGTGGGGGGSAHSSMAREIADAIREVMSQQNEALVQALVEAQRQTGQAIQDNLMDLRESTSGDKGHGRLDISRAPQTKLKQSQMEEFEKGGWMTLPAVMRSVLSELSAITLMAAEIDVQGLNKQINNLQGGMAASVGAARSFRIETTKALTIIRRQGGFTVDQLGAAATTILDLGVSSPKQIAAASETMLYGARALGAEVGDVAAHYGRVARDLRLSNAQTKQLISGTIQVAKSTGMTSKHVMEAHKQMKTFVDELSRAGPVSAELTNQIAMAAVTAEKLGVGQLQKDMMGAFTSSKAFFSKINEFGVMIPQIASRLAQAGHDYKAVMSGAFATTVSGQREIAKATRDMMLEWKEVTKHMSNAADRSIYLQSVSNGLVNSDHELNNALATQIALSETQAEKAKRLLDVRQQYNALVASGVNESIAEKAMIQLAGDTSIKNLKDLENSTKNAEANIFKEREDLASDFMNQVTMRQLDLMKFQAMGASQAQSEAFKELSGQLRGELAGMDLQKVSDLAAKGAERAAKEVADSAEQATDNMVDQVAKGVQKGIQMAITPIGWITDALDSAGIGVFAGAVAMLGTVVVLWTGGLKSFIGTMKGFKKAAFGLFGKGEGGPGAAGGAMDFIMGGGGKAAAGTAGKAAGGAMGTVMGGGGALAAGAAGNIASGAAGKGAEITGAATTLTDQVKNIGGASLELAKQLPKLLAAIAAIVVVGVTIGLSMRLLKLAFPPPEEVAAVAQSMVLSTLAFGVLAAAMWGLGKVIGTVGKVGEESAIMIAQGLVGLAAIAATGVLLAGLMWVMMSVWPEPEQIKKVSEAIWWSSIAMLGVAAALYLFLSVGAVLAPLSGPQALLVIAAVSIGIAALAGTAILLGVAMYAMSKAFPAPDEIKGVAEAVWLSAKALGVLAAAFLGIMAVGATVIIPMLLGGRLGVIGVMGSIAAGITMLAGTAWILGKGIQEMKGSFPHAEEIKPVAEAVEASANGLYALAKAYLIVLGVGALQIFSSGIAPLAEFMGFGKLITFGKKLRGYIEAMAKPGVLPEKEKAASVAETIKVMSDGIVNLAEAYAKVVASAKLSLWQLVLKIDTNKIAMNRIFSFGKALGKYVRDIKEVFPDKSEVENTASVLSTSASAVATLADASNKMAQAADHFDLGWFDFSGMETEDLDWFIRDLTSYLTKEGTGFRLLLDSMNQIPEVKDIARIQGAADAFSAVGTIIKSMTDIMGMFDTGWTDFSGIDLDDLDEFIKQVATALSDPNGGFTSMKENIASMPDISDDDVSKLKRFDEGVRGVLDILGSVGRIYKDYPKTALFGPSLDKLKKSLLDATDAIAGNHDAIANLRDSLGSLPRDFGERSESFSKGLKHVFTMFTTLDMLREIHGSKMGTTQETLSQIGTALSGGGLQSISDALAAVDRAMPERIEALAATVELVPRLVEAMENTFKVIGGGRLEKFSSGAVMLGDALQPLAPLAKALFFAAPSADSTLVNMSNLIGSLNTINQLIGVVGGPSDAGLANAIHGLASRITELEAAGMGFNLDLEFLSRIAEQLQFDVPSTDKFKSQLDAAVYNLDTAREKMPEVARAAFRLQNEVMKTGLDKIDMGALRKASAIMSGSFDAGMQAEFAGAANTPVSVALRSDLGQGPGQVTQTVKTMNDAMAKPGAGGSPDKNLVDPGEMLRATGKAGGADIDSSGVAQILAAMLKVQEDQAEDLKVIAKALTGSEARTKQQNSGIPFQKKPLNRGRNVPLITDRYEDASDFMASV
jgi:hypothetical protein